MNTKKLLSAIILNLALVGLFTGNISASSHDAGDASTLTTGDADVSVSIENNVNSNIATVEGGDTTIDTNISGNGAFSKNSIDIENISTLVVKQENVANVENDVSVSSNTGNNEIGGHTDHQNFIKNKFVFDKHHIPKLSDKFDKKDKYDDRDGKGGYVQKVSQKKPYDDKNERKKVLSYDKPDEKKDHNYDKKDIEEMKKSYGEKSYDKKSNDDKKYDYPTKKVAYKKVQEYEYKMDKKYDYKSDYRPNKNYIPSCSTNDYDFIKFGSKKSTYGWL